MRACFPRVTVPPPSTTARAISTRPSTASCRGSPTSNVIVDDGSTDGTAAILARAASRDPRITAAQRDQSRDRGAANRGLAVARVHRALDATTSRCPDARREVAARCASRGGGVDEHESMRRRRLGARIATIPRSSWNTAQLPATPSAATQVMFRGYRRGGGRLRQDCGAPLDSDLVADGSSGRIVVLPESACATASRRRLRAPAPQVRSASGCCSALSPGTSAVR